VVRGGTNAGRASDRARADALVAYQWTKPGPDSIEAEKDYLGFERWNRVEPEGSLMKAGARIAYGSDWPVDTLNEWFALQVGITRENPAGGKYAGKFTDQAVLPRKYALRSITASSSYELHQGQTGTLAPGKLADVIVLDRNFFEVPAGQIMDTRVLLTMVGGRCRGLQEGCDASGGVGEHRVQRMADAGTSVPLTALAA
jgi:predicted amidohydrolase YtcJ